MVIEYPPQTSLPLTAPGWKCLLVGKRIESRSQNNNTKCPAHYQTMCLVRHVSSLRTLTGWFM